LTEALTFLAPALVMCVVVASLHVYLGMHVLAREIIFVDLALAQLAALGATVGAVTESMDEGWTIEATGFGFTVVGAAIFTLARRSGRLVSQEAVVGVVYAVASAIMVLVLSRAPHGAEHIQDALIGSLLTVDWGEVWTVAATYAVLAILQVALARRFVALSWHGDDREETVGDALWDFAFYVLFGIAITISVRVAGILLVFSFLIVPAVVTRLFSDRLWPRLLAGWGVALAASVAGLWSSWEWDLPTGATIVTAFGALLAVAAAARAVTAVRAARA
jgi:zinc/manganese transport system permease protein